MLGRSAIAFAFCAIACSSGPPPAVKVASSVELGTLQQSPLVVGRDGAQTVSAWGREVWAFGDTFLSVPNDEGFNFVSNTVAFSPSDVTDGGLLLADRLDDAGAPDELLQPTADELAYDDLHAVLPDGGCLHTPCGGRWGTWPGPLLFDADAGTALAFYGLISATPGAFNFTGRGESVALWTDFDSLPVRPVLNDCPDDPTLLFCENEGSWGTAAALDQGMVFTFGCGQSGFSFPCQLARVPFAQATQKSAWQAWTGSEWSSDLSKATTLFNGASIMGLFFNDYVGQWMLIYAQASANQVVVRTAPALTGPWSGEGNLFVPDRNGMGGNTYDALPHPELAEENGRIQYVTFSRGNGTTFGSEFALVQVTFQ